MPLSDRLRRDLQARGAKHRNGKAKAGVAATSDAWPAERRGDADERDYGATPSNGKIATGGWETIIPFPAVPEADPFPLDTLPDSLRRFVADSAWALNCPPDYLAVPLLALAGAGIGASRALEIKAGWRERPALYAAVIGSPGSAKTPALKAVAAPLYAAQATRHKTFKSELLAWREGDEKGDKPKLESLYVSDATTEALALILEENPRGVAIVRDELTAWVTSLDQYRARGRGADRQFYLSAWAGEPVSVHRKNQDAGPVFVPHPFVAVVGGLPPDLLDRLRGERDVSDGFLDRVLLSYPKPLPAVGENWRAVEEPIRANWTEALGKLWALQPDRDEQGNPRPHVVYLDSTARKAWERFTEGLAAAMNAPEFPDLLRGPWQKLRGYCARLALIIHALHHDDESTVTGATIDRAAALVAYFQSHARKVYSLLGADEEIDSCRRVLEWIARERRETFKAWELHRDVKNQGQFPTLEALDRPLGRLAKHNYIRLAPAPEGGGPGRPPAPTYEVNPAAVLDRPG